MENNRKYCVTAEAREIAYRIIKNQEWIRTKEELVRYTDENSPVVRMIEIIANLLYDNWDMWSNYDARSKKYCELWRIIEKATSQYTETFGHDPMWENVNLHTAWAFDILKNFGIIKIKPADGVDNSSDHSGQSLLDLYGIPIVDIYTFDDKAIFNKLWLNNKSSTPVYTTYWAIDVMRYVKQKELPGSISQKDDQIDRATENLRSNKMIQMTANIMNLFSRQYYIWMRDQNSTIATLKMIMERYMPEDNCSLTVISEAMEMLQSAGIICFNPLVINDTVPLYNNLEIQLNTPIVTYVIFCGSSIIKP